MATRPRHSNGHKKSSNPSNCLLNWSKEIEVGFPSAQTEFDFARKLIDENLVPDDAALQVLTQAREHLIKRSFESLKGAKKAIVHVYNSTSPLQRKVTFGMSKEQIKQIAVDGVKLIRDLLPVLDGTEVRLEYSPESFSDTEVDFALEVCEAVMEAWNLPSKLDHIEPAGNRRIVHPQRTCRSNRMVLPQPQGTGQGNYKPAYSQ